MDYFRFCCLVIESEMQKFNLDSSVYQSCLSELTSNWDINFDIAYNRCAFMYKYATCNMLYFKSCIKTFLLACPDFSSIVSSWNSVPDIGLCSFTCGPALDYLAFMSALSEHISPPSFKTITILSKHGAWRNTIGFVPDAMMKTAMISYDIPRCFNYENVKVIQNDLLKLPFSGKGSTALSNAQVILMVKSLNLAASGSEEEENIKLKLKEMITFLRSGATVFFIDTKPSLALFTEILAGLPGKFLYNPVHSTFRVPSVSESDINAHGCTPIITTRGAFFVWQKTENYCILNSKLFPKISPICKEEKKNEYVGIGNNDTVSTSTEFSLNTSGDALNIVEEISDITKTLKTLIFSDSVNLGTHCMTPTANLLHSDKEEQSDSGKNNETFMFLQNTEHINTKPLVINQSAVEKNPDLSDNIMQNSFTSGNESGYFEKIFPQCFDVKFPLQSSPLLGKGNKLLNTSPICNNVEINKASVKLETKKKLNTNSKKDVLNSTCFRPLLQSKAIQTDPSIEEEPNSYSNIKDLTDRVRRLVDSYEKELELQKNCNHQVHHSTHDAHNKSIFNASCSSRHFCNHDNSCPDAKQQCCICNQPQRNTFNNCCVAQSSCTNGYRMIHCCGTLHCHESHSPRCCHMTPQRMPCENNFNNLTGPNIVIPLQNINDEILTQIMRAIKTNSKSN
ncbi:uncharacterized protein NPIL_302921 [Nephila pilipes]|uniref:Uncharacterized protein n=1 Tax=Nephila pilipes TaxID=299642 RepID=A0A8X6MSV1_NEPPI|nr:uncharacterized protein NPIL_302921 [Nephila pilipes]